MEHPTTPVAMGPPPIHDVSPNRGASSPSSRHYARLLSARASRSLAEPLVPGQLNCHSHQSFARLFS